ncbi:uncharacterized protein LOC113520301 [Galleria mellonella]|uniref:Uncharacterized protein LOC113520301 n=1 Tax=Galleria mellonella TaxID=7137 RepID=A0A6J1X5E0_GALME|nr:uncharacterized protein LOC113520301 [Galleria mellonella]
MQLCVALCCVLVTITVTTTRVRGESQNQGLIDRKSDKRISKREATLLIDDFHVQPIYTHKPKVIYRRVSRIVPPKPSTKYRPPRPKYGPYKGRKPGKKYRKQVPAKFGPSSYKPRSPKPRYTSKRPSTKPKYSVPKKVQHYTPYPPEPTGFGEPPSDFANDYPPQKQSYGEPPVDSYGAPLKTKIIEPYPTQQIYSENPTHASQFEKQNFAPDYLSWQSFQRDKNIDNQYAYSQKRPTYIRPEVLERPNVDDNEDPELITYSDIYAYNNKYKDPYYLHNKKKKPQFLADSGKVPKNRWKTRKLKPDEDEEILVGGQYAEPPARYVPKFQPSAPMYNDEDDFAPQPGFRESDIASSATISPYVNYKNSNMAFSPQNLNDAFSIVEK